MKRYFQKYFDAVFSGFRSYRKWRGGKWYKVLDEDPGNGMAGQYAYWRRIPPAAGAELDIEDYSGR